MKRIKQILTKNKKEIIAGIVFVVSLCLFSFSYAFASTEPVRSITITSRNTSYENSEEGSWQVTKSGYWTNYGEAEVVLDVDTTLMTNNQYTDIIFVLDISGSMSGEKLDRVKNDSKNFIHNLLSTNGNRAALITFDASSRIVLNLTDDEEMLLNEIDCLQGSGSLKNYYQALVNVDTILQNYRQESGREMIVLFLTDGYPNQDIPNQVGEYQYLKSAYPYITINAIQYEMGNIILSPIKEISDNQFSANMESLSRVLSAASVVPVSYEKYQVIDYIDNENFYIESIDDIKVSSGNVELVEVDERQKITWTLDNLLSGDEVNLTMKLNLKDEFVDQSGIYPTNESTEVISKIEQKQEAVTTTDTPILSNNYTVTYDGNAPEECSIDNVVESENYFVFDNVELSNVVPTCEGYQFKGWKITTDGVTKINDDYFVMPEENVEIKAEWSKLSTTKTMDGNVYVAPTLYDLIEQDAVMDNTSSEFVSSSSGIDFTSISSDTNGKGIYIRAGTKNDKYPVLYYRGDVDNNHVKFGGFCWKIVRTTDTGGTKLIYDGVPNSNGYCQNTGEDSQIGTSKFNSDYHSPSDVGYMVGVRHTWSSQWMNPADTTRWVYGNDVIWDGSNYTLVDTVESAISNWSSDRENVVGNGHRYTCLSTSNTCNTVYYVFYTGTFMNTVIQYMTLTNGLNIDGFLNELFPEDSNLRNQTDSEIKTTIDTWYSNNMTEYTKYLEDTVWCNDRSIYSKGGFDNNFSEEDESIYFGPFGRRHQTHIPSTGCPNQADSFTVSSENGNGKLTYPVALLTADETTLAGAKAGYTNDIYYLNTGETWWTLSPQGYNYLFGYLFSIRFSGDLYYSNDTDFSTNGVRPAISLRNDLVVSKGEGTSENPYELVLE